VRKSPAPPQQSTLRLLRKIFNGMDKRPSLMGGAAREGLDAHLLAVLAEFADRHQTKALSLAGSPPRRVSLAMAMALLCQPHLSVTFADLDPIGDTNLWPWTQPEPERPFLLDTEVMSEVLALSHWEIDHLREDVDRKVGQRLKQQRALRWLWGRYKPQSETADSLLQILFPGITDEHCKLFGIGGQLYAQLSGDTPAGVPSLFIPHPENPTDDFINPRETFRARFVDRSLIEALAKGIGADEEEVHEILNHMICAIPRLQARDFIDSDMWRIAPYDGMTQLTKGYTATQWLYQPLHQTMSEPLDIWLEAPNGKLNRTLAENRFDYLVYPRLRLLLRQIHAQSFSNLLVEHSHEPHSAKFPWVRLSDLDGLQLATAFESIIQPILDWCLSDEAAESISQHMKLQNAATKSLQKELHACWTQRNTQLWSGGPRADGHQTTLTRLTAHIGRTAVSMRKTWHRRPIYDIPHRNTLLLFAGHYFSEMPLEGAWADSGDAHGTDPIGQWFWPTWQRILNTLEENNTLSISYFDD